MAVTLPKLDQQIPSGPGGVEIAGFPQILHTRSFGHPDLLFIPLLEGAREAVNLCERLTTGGETREHAATMSGIQLVSGLLKDSSFSLSARGLQEEHFYFVDLAAGTISVKTRLYAEVSRRTSMFKVEIAGNIRDGIYAVRSVGDSSASLQFDEQQVRQPMFFSTILAEQCLRLKVQQDQSRGMGATPAAPDTTEMHLMVPVANRKIPVVLKQKELNGEWEILEAQLRTRIGELSPDATNHLQLLLAGLSTILAAVPGSASTVPAPSPSLVGAAKDSSRP